MLYKNHLCLDQISIRRQQPRHYDTRKPSPIEAGYNGSPLANRAREIRNPNGSPAEDHWVLALSKTQATPFHVPQKRSIVVEPMTLYLPLIHPWKDTLMKGPSEVTGL